MKNKIGLLALLFGLLIFTGASCIQLGNNSASGPMGVYRSNDAGLTWVEKFAFPTAQGVKSIGALQVYRIFTDPSDPNALYLGTRGQGLYYSYNNGETWQFSNGTKDKYIYGLSIDPKDKCNIFMTDGQHILKTDDCMRSWKMVFTEERPSQRFVAVAVDPANSDIIYGAQLGGDILRSRDGGNSWRIVKRFNFEIRHMAMDPDASGRIYVAAYRNGLHRSDDGGENWKDLSASFSSFTDSKTFYRLILNPAQKNSLFWISKYGLLRSNDAGETWSEIKLLTPQGSVNIYAFALNPKNQSEMYYTGTILGDKNKPVRSTLYKSVDGGTSWVTKKMPTNTIPIDLLVYPNDGNILFLAFTLL